MRPGLMKKEPLLTIAGVTAAVTAMITLVTSFGVKVTDEQQVAILSIVAIGAPALVALIGRTKVYSPAHVDELETTAAAELVQATKVSGLMAVPPDEDLFDLVSDESLDEYDKNDEYDEYDEYDEDDEYDVDDDTDEDPGPLFNDNDLVAAETPRDDEGTVNV